MAIEKLFDRFVRATEPDDRKLYRTSVLFSLFHLGLMWHAYLTLHRHPPYALVIMHMVFVGVLYALPKEIVRWHNGRSFRSAKAGHLLVLTWGASFILMILGEYFIDAKDYKLPEGMTEMSCFLVAALGVTLTSKMKHELKHPPCQEPQPPSSGPSEPPPTETKTTP